MAPSLSSLWRVAALAALLVAPHAFAGECVCGNDFYSKVLLGTATPEEKAGCEGETGRKQALLCLGGLSYKSVRSGDQSVESFRLAVEALVAVAADKSLGTGPVGLLLASESYRDTAMRDTVRPVMVRAGRAALWDTLVKASEGDKAALTQALYQYCDQYAFIVELVDRETLTLEAFWPPPTGLKPREAARRLKCPYGQRLLLDAALRSREGELPAEALSLLSAQQLRLLRNAVYARHGRPFEDRELEAFFSAQPWYRKDAAYTDARLTPEDQRTLELIQKAEQRVR